MTKIQDTVNRAPKTSAAVREKSMTTYTITIRMQSPSWDELDGIVYENISARTKSEAITQIRRRATNDGHVGYGRGRYTISATETESPR